MDARNTEEADGPRDCTGLCSRRRFLVCAAVVFVMTIIAIAMTMGLHSSKPTDPWDGSNATVSDAASHISNAVRRAVSPKREGEFMDILL